MIPHQNKFFERLLYLGFMVIYSKYIYFIEQIDIANKYPRAQCLDKEKKQTKPPHWQMNRHRPLPVFLCPRYELERIQIFISQNSRNLWKMQVGGLVWVVCLGFFCRNMTNSWVCIHKIEKNTDDDAQKGKEGCWGPCWATALHLKGSADGLLRIYEAGMKFPCKNWA